MHKLNLEQVLEIPTLAKEGKSVPEIAKKFDVTTPAIWYWIGKLRARGFVIKTNKPGKRPLLNHDYAVSNEN